MQKIAHLEPNKKSSNENTNALKEVTQYVNEGSSYVDIFFFLFDNDKT